MIRRWAGRVFPWLAWLYVVSLLFQVLLAGLAVFVDPATFRIHVDFGRFVVGVLTLLLPIVAWLGRLPSVRLAVGVLLFYLLQTGLPEVKASYPVVAALHPVLALILFWLAVRLANQAQRHALQAESTSPS
ncbi:MAG: DUF6220 domain-containing protein [Chloroflexota bacterium]